MHFILVCLLLIHSFQTPPPPSILQLQYSHIKRLEALSSPPAASRAYPHLIGGSTATAPDDLTVLIFDTVLHLLPCQLLLLLLLLLLLTVASSRRSTQQCTELGSSRPFLPPRRGFPQPPARAS
eukprot:764262-Hanusia_phi.AAC.4